MYFANVRRVLANDILVLSIQFSFNLLLFRRMQQAPSADSLAQVNKSPLNNSKSKAMFTFPKDERFPVIKPETCVNFYEKPGMLDKRTTTFGYGQKSDIALNNSSPSPDKYNLASDFEKGKKVGVTIGHGREDCKSVSIFTQSQSKNPGPGQYNLTRDKENVKDLTISQKLKFPSLWAESFVPGPGAYDVQKVDVNGHCSISKYNSKNSFRIHPKSPEKQKAVFQMLGPGTYNTNLSSTGKQVLARNKTEKSFIFSKKVRETMMSATINPGPGAYKHYSIFGLN